MGQRAAHVDHRLTVVIRAVEESEVEDASLRGSLANHVEDTAGSELAVQDRGRSFEQFHRLDGGEVGEGGRASGRHEAFVLHAVDHERSDVEAAHLEALVGTVDGAHVGAGEELDGVLNVGDAALGPDLGLEAGDGNGQVSLRRLQAQQLGGRRGALEGADDDLVQMMHRVADTEFRLCKKIRCACAQSCADSYQSAVAPLEYMFSHCVNNM